MSTAAFAALSLLWVKRKDDSAEASLERLYGIAEESLIYLPDDEFSKRINAIDADAGSHNTERRSKIPSLP